MELKILQKITKFRKTLNKWYSINARKFGWRESARSSYEKIIAEVLLQRTQAQNVHQIYEQFLKTFPSWQSIAKARMTRLENALKPVGLWRQRSQSLKRLSKAIIANGGDIPHIREEIDELPGVGQYIANAIELLLHKRPLPLVDVNMARVLERYFGPRKLADIRYDPYLQDLARKVVKCKDPVAINFAILDFAALVCKARNPLCAQCPLVKDCLYASRVANVGENVSLARREKRAKRARINLK